MMNIDELDEKFSIEGELGFSEIENGLVFITVSNKYAEAEIFLYGAHVTSFRPHNTMEILYLSPQSYFEPGKPIRGGIPVCFPWFGINKADPEKPMHGFGRLMNWDVAETKSLPNGETFVKLVLLSDAGTKAYWPNDFRAEMIFLIGKTLTVTLKVTNTSSQPFDYSCALHSYFFLSSIDNIEIEGLQGVKYFDQLLGSEHYQEEEIIEISKALTHHYLDTETPCVIDDAVFRRRINVSKSGSRVTTVWNPGKETCEKIEDLPDFAFEEFVCIETVNAFNNILTLSPGQSHETSAIIGIEE